MLVHLSNLNCYLILSHVIIFQFQLIFLIFKIDFTPMLERIEDESSVESLEKPIEKSKKIHPQRPRLDSADADVEDSDAEEP